MTFLNLRNRGITKLSKKYYVFQLDNPATPGFCSFNKLYVGTEETLKAVASNLEKKNHYPETAAALRSYFNGNTDVTHRIAYSTIKILTPIEIENEHKISFAEKRWIHINIWGFPYAMKCDSGITHQIVFKHEDKYYRCIRAWLKNLCYEGVNGNWHQLTGGFWGNDSILDVAFMPNKTNYTFNNLLYVTEEIYEDDVKKALDDMLLEEKIEMKGICDEIFADG